MMEILVDSVSFTYPGGVNALRAVSLRIAPGERVAIIGQNGAGKTTLAKHLNGLLRPTSGSVSVGGWDTRQHPVAQMAARVGYVFQNPDDQLFKTTVWAEVTFGPKNLGWPSERVDAQARTALEMVGLSAAASRHPHDLSLGQRKSVALATVLTMDTPILILDEPTSGQDFAGQEQIGRIVADLHLHGKTVITISHDMDFCAEHFERAVVLADGQVLADGPARQVLAQAEMLAATDLEPPQIARLAARLGMESLPLTVDEFVEAIQHENR